MGVIEKTLAQWFRENPQVAAEWDYETNTHISVQDKGFTVRKKAWWICEKGHRYETYVFSRTLYGTGCPYCAGKKALAGFNDLATTKPDILTQWDYEKNTDILPTEVTEFSHKKVWWKCEKGHSWNARVLSVTSLNGEKTGCPYCAGLRVWKGENDLATLFPELMNEWCYDLNEISPSEISSSDRQRCWWKCEKGHTWQASPFARTNNPNSKCIYCANLKVWVGFNDLATLAPEIAAEWCYELNGELKPTDVSKGARTKVWWKCSEGHTWQAMIHARTRTKRTNCPVCASKQKNKD